MPIPKHLSWLSWSRACACFRNPSRRTSDRRSSGNPFQTPMIPLHRPAFGLGTVIKASLIGVGQHSDLERVEEAFASASTCENAIWLPSARAGICWALRAAIGSQTTVIGPAFTCPAVHEAMLRSGGTIRLIDAGEQGFGMEPQELRCAQRGNHALVLSELFGHSCDFDQPDDAAASSRKIRIVDSAMAFPHRALFDRLRGNDFMVISLGKGKNMFSGWGGIGFTADRALAQEVRDIRDGWLTHGNYRLALRRVLHMTVRATAHYPSVYPMAHKLSGMIRSIRIKRPRPQDPSPGSAESAPAQEFPAAWLDDRNCGAEWHLPSTYVDRHLALWNLDTMAAADARRRQLVSRYDENLAGLAEVMRPPLSRSALSHYTVRVKAEIRDVVADRLSRSGIYTALLWPRQPHVSREKYPRASLLSSEVINLPVSPRMKSRQVDSICQLLEQCFA